MCKRRNPPKPIRESYLTFLHAGGHTHTLASEEKIKMTPLRIHFPSIAISYSVLINLREKAKGYLEKVSPQRDPLFH